MIYEKKDTENDINIIDNTEIVKIKYVVHKK